MVLDTFGKGLGEGRKLSPAPAQGPQMTVAIPSQNKRMFHENETQLPNSSLGAPRLKPAARPAVAGRFVDFTENDIPLMQKHTS